MQRSSFDFHPYLKWIRQPRWTAFELPRLQAHRGARHEGVRENSLEAFRQAKHCGFEMCEVDIQLTKDEVPVAWHDKDLLRLTGRPEQVSSLTAGELKDLVGAPSLEELLIDPSCPRLWNLEMKTSEVLNEPLERKVAQVIHRVGAEQRILISSFNPFSLWKISRFLPDVPRAWIVSGEMDPLNHWTLRKLLYAPLMSFHLLHLDHRDVTESFLSRMLSEKLRLALWTVNDLRKTEEYLKAGVCSVITDLREAARQASTN